MLYRLKNKFLLLTLAAGLVSCSMRDKTDDIYSISNGGIKATFTAYGARLTGLQVPAKDGKSVPVVWGFDSTAQYRRCKTDLYYGAVIGRYANRIAGGKFMLGATVYPLDQNDGRNSLHGGVDGFFCRQWSVLDKTDSSLVFAYRSADGEGGYPGTLDVRVTYTLTADHALRIGYEATTDKPTVVNLTNHAYWNLNGAGSGTILGHKLMVRAAAITPVDSTLIPLGNPSEVAGTPFDFRSPMPIGDRIGLADEQLKNGRGYDHNFILDSHDIRQPVAELVGDKTGIVMQIFTDQPGLQFYSGNFMAGHNRMNGGAVDRYRTGLCLETQHFPDSPNQRSFPSTELKPGEQYRSTTTYRFIFQTK